MANDVGFVSVPGSGTCVAMCGGVVCGFVLLVLLSGFGVGVVPLMSLLLAPLAEELGLSLPLEYVSCGVCGLAELSTGV